MMFAILRRLVRRRPPNREQYIFRFFDGREWTAVDPIPTWLALEADQNFLGEQDLARIEQGETAVVPHVAAAVRRAFELPDFADGGLTDLECLELYGRFNEWLGALKKNGSGPPTSPTPTEPPSSDASVTNAVSDSGSIESEPKPANLPA